ncbi:MocR-like pyridoxine biosynthesis transcription factor PdxR [Variovorax sp. JS1663]|uniref:MocR-like pyridoxine biosynthesis transcription factor PdxR n=1 Tax=Variovorax sp. JS1663 TaxID=1851577 RepID=UPI001EDE5549|nr:PLP-dependent aminotransferase family protein [Variovorax sp. JS1663]
MQALPDFVLRQFDRQTSEYDHLQLYRILQTGIRHSELSAGLKLPPTRVLAQALGIARNTVVHVYEQLALEGYVEAGVGRGTYVTHLGLRTVKAARTPASNRDEPLSQRGRALIEHAGAARLQWGAFTPGVPEVRMFPVRIWNSLQSRVWRYAAPAQLTYATGAGDAGLRQAVAEYLQGTRGVACTAEQVVITSGTQQSLLLIAQLLADPGDTAWLEDPGYWGARSVFRAMGLRLLPIGVDGEGLAPTPQQLRRPPRLMFVSPAHQYPVGALMSHRRRRQLLDYAAMHGSWVVEDDYDSEFRYGTRPLPALQGLDEHSRVIYLGTFSKTLFPSLRVAYAVLPPDLVEGFARSLNELFREGHTMQQAVLARFMAEGHYATHIRRMRTVYSARHDALIHAIRKQFGADLQVLGGAAGLHVVLELPQHVSDESVARDAQLAGVTTRPLSMYYMRKSAATNGLLLGYGTVHEKEIESSFATLATVLRRHL